MRRASGGSPPKGFASRDLVIAEMAPGGVWRRIYESRFPDPLGYGFGPSRFSDPKTMLVPPDRFGVVYLGSSVKVCFAEAILRDRGVRRVKAFPLEWAELERWTCAELRTATALRLVDLRGTACFAWVFRPMSRARVHRHSDGAGHEPSGPMTRSLTGSSTNLV
jgi:hypothetical protein